MRIGGTCCCGTCLGFASLAQVTSLYGPQDSRQVEDRPVASVGTDRLELSPEAQQELVKLRARDQEVRAHEQAHLSAAGGLAKGGANYSYQRGPDGQRYAVGGEVDIDTSPVLGNPAATLAKARQIQAAANAPAQPSPQDQAVAAQAAAMAAQAQVELAKKQTEKPTNDSRLDIVA